MKFFVNMCTEVAELVNKALAMPYNTRRRSLRKLSATGEGVSDSLGGHLLIQTYALPT